MDVAEARTLLGVGANADASGINGAFRTAVVALDLAEPSHRLRLERLIEAREWLLGRLDDDTAEAITLDPSDVIELFAEPRVSSGIDGQEEAQSSPGADEQPSPSALRDFLDRTVVHEQAGAPLPDALIRWAALAATATIAWGAIAIPLRPDGHWSRILYVLGDQAAWLAEQSHRAAVVLILLGLLLFAAVFGLLGVRQERGRYVAAAHIGVSSLAAAPGTFVVLILLLNGLGVLLLAAAGCGLLYWMFMLFVNQDW